MDCIHTEPQRIASTIIVLWLLFMSCSFQMSAQETNANVSGIIKSEKNEILRSATVTVVHQPTQNTYSTETNSKGYFYFFNIRPGGPYSITITYSGFEPLWKTDLFLSYSGQNFYSYLQGSEFSEFILREKNDMLDEVTIKGKRRPEARYGLETNIDNDKINSLPSISRNLQDYVRLVPNAKVNGDGMMSLAGQNNKYNSFFIDGSNYNDMLGLALSGTSGGQTGAPPVSIEAIEEIKVSQSPFDVQYSNFTGGSINAITKSGSNEFKSAAWYFFRNESMAGKSPVPVELPGGEVKRIRLSRFFNQTGGLYVSGPFKKNKLFYFFLAEWQNELQPQPYDFSSYGGTSTQQQLSDLADTVRKRYHYEPGSFLESANKLYATRFMAKLDWNPNTKNKFVLSYRYNNGERMTPISQNSSTIIRFSNSRYRLPSTISSGSLEWKSFLTNAMNNRLLITYNHEITERRIIGQPFPMLTINDGSATVTLGSNGSGQINRFTSSESTILNVFRYVRNKNVIGIGLDLNFGKIKDIALNSYFGQYRYASVNDFLANEYPSRYLRTFSLADKPVNDETNAGAKYNTLRGGFFLSDELQISEQLKLIAGIRIDANGLRGNRKADVYFNTIARPEIEKYYDLEGAVAGKLMKTAWQLSPRVGFDYKIPEERITIRGGGGIFCGHILNVWASQLYASNVANLNVSAQQYSLHFNADPYNQPDFQTLGIDPDKAKGNLILIARNYKYPTVFRTALGFVKNLQHNYNITTDVFFTKNIYENRYSNVSLLPSSRTSQLPGSRNVYSTNPTPDKITLPGGNPYDYIFLLGNNQGKKSFSYGFITSVNKSFTQSLQIDLTYSFQNSVALFEPGGTANTNDGQWMQLESVNGKNLATNSVSDFDLGHRISFAFTKKIRYGKSSSMITVFYNGQSGSPFSYVYERSMINDNGVQTQFNADLIYIPTRAELDYMTFVTNSTNNIPPQQQKELLNDFIESDRYLHKHRGEFAERNGARLPFTHTIDLRLQQNLKIKLNKKETMVSIIYDVFNFTNMLNRNWGRTYFLSNDNYGLIRFAGFSNVSLLAPQYQFKPLNGRPWSIENSTAPGNSARWLSQLGVKLNFN